MVSIQRQPTASAGVDPFSQRLFLAVSTLTTVLRRVGWIDRNHRSTSIGCFVCELCGTLRPRGVLNTLGQAVVMHHLIDRHIFDGDQGKPIDEASALLMGKVPTIV